MGKAKPSLGTRGEQIRVPPPPTLRSQSIPHLRPRPHPGRDRAAVSQRPAAPPRSLPPHLPPEGGGRRGVGPGLRSEIWGTGDVRKCYLKVEIDEIDPLLNQGASRTPLKTEKSTERVGVDNLHRQISSKEFGSGDSWRSKKGLVSPTKLPPPTRERGPGCTPTPQDWGRSAIAEAQGSAFPFKRCSPSPAWRRPRPL